jgi:hypothetical protein
VFEHVKRQRFLIPTALKRGQVPDVCLQIRVVEPLEVDIEIARPVIKPAAEVEPSGRIGLGRGHRLNVARTGERRQTQTFLAALGHDRVVPALRAIDVDIAGASGVKHVGGIEPDPTTKRQENLGEDWVLVR